MNQPEAQNERTITNLKTIIRGLHEGDDPEVIQRQIDALVSNLKAVDLIHIEQRLLNEGICPEDLVDKCDIHAQVLENALFPPPVPNVPPGHPLDTFHRENKAIENSLNTLRGIVSMLQSASSENEIETLRLLCLQVCQDLMDIEKHYLRKQHLLYPLLEEKKISCPQLIMTAKDQQVLSELDQLFQTFYQPREGPRAFISQAADVVESTIRSVESMVFKEERVLLPASYKILSDEQWGRVFYGSALYGWCLIEPREGYRPPAGSKPFAPDFPNPQGMVVLPNGCLPVNHLISMFRHLPVDITLIDKNNRVAFYSDGIDPIVKRKKFILGRKIQCCFPPRYIDRIVQIESQLRKGEHERLVFQYPIHGEPVSIQYVRVIDEFGDYNGFLETKQKIAPAAASPSS